MEYLATKADIQEVKALIEGKANSMFKWFLGILIALVLAALTALFKSGL